MSEQGPALILRQVESAGGPMIQAQYDQWPADPAAADPRHVQRAAELRRQVAVAAAQYFAFLADPNGLAFCDTHGEA